MPQRAVDQQGNVIEYVNGQWAPAGGPVGGHFAPSARVASGTLEGVQQAGLGALSTGANIIGAIPGVDKPGAEFFEQARSENPVTFGGGEVAAASLLGFGGGAAVNNLAGGGIFGNVAGGAAGSIVSALGLEDDVLETMENDLLFSAGLFALGSAGQMGVRIGRKIKNLFNERPKSRTVEVGPDASEVDLQARIDDLQGQDLGDGRTVEITPGQASGDPIELADEDALRSQFVGTGGFKEIDQGQQDLLNQRVRESIGIPGGGKVRKGTLDTARDTITGNMKTLRDEVGDMPIDNNVLTRLRALQADEGLTDQARGVISQEIKHMEQLQSKGGAISPDRWQQARVRFTSAAATAASQGDQITTPAMWEAVDAIDTLPANVMQGRGVSSNGWFDRFAEAREQFRNLIAVKRKGVVDGGEVSRLRLNNSLDGVYGDTYRFNNGTDANVRPATQNLFNTTETLIDPRMNPRVQSETSRRIGPEVRAQAIGQGVGALTTGNPQGLIKEGVSQLVRGNAAPSHLAGPTAPIGDINNEIIAAFSRIPGLAAGVRDDEQ